MSDPTDPMVGKVVVVTGGARGIGLATATKLHRLGALVAIGDIDETELKTAAVSAGIPFYAPLDVTDQTSFAEFLDSVEHELGAIDVLVNNAGIMPIGRVVDEPDGVTRRILDINVYGVILGSKLAASRMIPRRSGHIINVASLAGENPTAGLATYCASKHAVLGFTDSARLEYRGTGVAFSSLLPTFTNTELVTGTSGARGVRNAEPGEIADGVVALIRRPKRRLVVTRIAGLLSAVIAIVPSSASEAISTALGMHSVFLSDVDSEERDAYEKRARGL